MNTTSTAARGTGQGLLVTLDGPGGAGKTTTAARLAALLTSRGHPVHATTQPSTSEIGRLARAYSSTYRGRALACLVAADRYHQQTSEIRPARQAGRIVVCDRYVAASYVLQRMDGVDLPFLDALNAAVDPPDLAIILTADPAVTSARVDRRGTRHRFETGLSSSTHETHLYTEATHRLTRSGYPLVTIDTTTTTPDEVADRIATLVEQRIAEHTGGPTGTETTA